MTLRSCLSLAKKWFIATSLSCLLFPFSEAFGSGNFQESFIEDVRGISHFTQSIKGLYEYNEQQYNEINALIQKKIGYTPQVGNTNFASIRVFYRKQGSDVFEGVDLPLSKNVFFVSSQEAIQDEVIFLQQERPSDRQLNKEITEIVLDSYAHRGNLEYQEIKDGPDKGRYKVRIIDGEEKKFYPLNLFKYDKWNPLYPKLVHSEQRFLDYYLLGDPSAVVINKDIIDCILINIVSRFATCPNCYIALETLLSGKNGIKGGFLSRAFPNSNPDIPIHILYNSVTDSTHRQQIRNVLKLARNKRLQEVGHEKIDLADGNIHFINTEFGSFLKKKQSIISMSLIQEDEEEKIEDPMIKNVRKGLTGNNLGKLLNIANERLSKDINEAFEALVDAYDKMGKQPQFIGNIPKLENSSFELPLQKEIMVNQPQLSLMGSNIMLNPMPFSLQGEIIGEQFSQFLNPQKIIGIPEQIEQESSESGEEDEDYLKKKRKTAEQKTKIIKKDEREDPSKRGGSKRGGRGSGRGRGGGIK